MPGNEPAANHQRDGAQEDRHKMGGVCGEVADTMSSSCPEASVKRSLLRKQPAGALSVEGEALQRWGRRGRGLAAGCPPELGRAKAAYSQPCWPAPAFCQRGKGTRA
eukprot:848845-Pelagomonas_calceolata.AAC.6